MGIAAILFWILSALTIFSAIMILVSKNPVHSVLWLIATFFAISGHYILLNAQFLAIVNIIVYAGAIMVLFLFVIMLMNLDARTETRKNLWMKLAGVISGGMLLWILISVVRTYAEQTKGHPDMAVLNTGTIGLIKPLGKVLFTQYALPFELCSILFLSAMVGAVVIGKKN
ncbi:MAG TPA: NADH-quinone oxidoreductase subunit J [Arachidicoccus sp.]|nr:NADH-quinone oxidoreductase subunit J [Arachidicoccus sp.]